jgi:hypothetical protein
MCAKLVIHKGLRLGVPGISNPLLLIHLLIIYMYIYMYILFKAWSSRD